MDNDCFTNDTLAMQIDLNGHVTMPKQPAFSVTSKSIKHNLTINANNTIQFLLMKFLTKMLILTLQIIHLQHQ
jgi:hypothetical protein